MINNSSLDTGMLDWIDNELAPVISAISSEDFFSRLVGFLRNIAECDSIVVLSYFTDRPPQVLYEALSGQDREALHGPYFNGAYLLSPFYLKWLEDKSSVQIHRLKEIVPDGFFDSIFFNDYYMRSGLRDEIAYLLPVDKNSSVLLSLGRAKIAQPYTTGELNTLDALSHLVASCLKPHVGRSSKTDNGGLENQLTEHLSNFGRGLLTAREQLVVQMMLRGHSSKSCARELNISPTTERVHRRNIYAKLGVSSQAELFPRFFDTLLA